MATPAEKIPNPETVNEHRETHPADAFRHTRLVGVTGAAGSGKDTIADHIATLTDCVRMSCADPIKSALTVMFGFPAGAWLDRDWKERMLPMIGRSPRQLAQTLGTEWGRNMVNPDIWISTVMARWRNQGCPITVIPDIRFENEAMAVLRAGGLLISVDRPGVNPVAQHPSEQPIPANMIHHALINDGTIEDLQAKVDKALLDHAKMIQNLIEQQQANANPQ